MKGALKRPTSAGSDAGHRAIGVFLVGHTQWGQLAAPSTVGRPRGLGDTPSIFGLFRRGRAVGISQINAIATNVPRGG